MQVYAARFDPATKAPRIAILIAGVGLDETASENALRTLPAAVTLAVSPYARTPDAVVAVARQTGHEYLASIPMEPQGYALNDPGNRALLSSAPPADNARLLDWVLSHLAAYVGATGALGDMRGERFAQVEDQMVPVLATLATRPAVCRSATRRAPAALRVVPHGRRSADRGVDRCAARGVGETCPRHRCGARFDRCDPPGDDGTSGGVGG
jgi:uncharacterized protein